MPLSSAAAVLAVETFFGEITKSLLRGEDVQIRGFGTFKARKYKAYRGRSPRTGQAFHVKPRKRPVFKPAGSLKSQLNKQ